MPKAGAYYFYMLEFKKQKERSLGRTLTLPEASQMASSSWDATTEDEKSFYKEKAKGGEVKIPRRNSVNNGQLTTHGVPVTEYDRDIQKKERAEEVMRLRVASMIQKLPLFTEFIAHPIYLMFGNYFYKNNDGTYFPAELGICKFTFRDGVLKRFHTFIDPGKVQQGFAYAAKEHSESTHRLPRPPQAYGEKNFGRIVFEIQKFMKGDGEFDGGNQMVFAYVDPYASEDNQIEILKSFMQQFNDGKELKFDLYPLTRLFYVLQKELAKQGRCDDIPNEKFTNVLLSRDPYETMGGISCQYHESIDATRHCALSRVNRLAFLLADHFCERLGVELVPGTHLPGSLTSSLSMVSLGSRSESQSVISELKDQFEDGIKNGRERLSQFSSSNPKMHSQEALNAKSQDSCSSISSLRCEIQSIRTGSTVTNGAQRTSGSERESGSERVKTRQSRASIAAASRPPQPSSSTFYNP